MSNSCRFLPRALWLACLAVVPPFLGTPALAAGWQTILASNAETIEIDTSRIVHGSNRTTAWSRVNLGRDVQEKSGRYNAIEAQNSYDCEGHSFTTLRRVYFKGDIAIREEPVARQRTNVAAAGSIDERLLNEVCKPRTTGQLASIAQRAGQAAADIQAESRPGMMHADMRSKFAEGTVRVVPVADTHGAEPHAPVIERPKMIELPKIDKEAAAAAAGQNASAAAANAVAGSAMAAKPAAGHSASAAPVAAPAPVVKPRALSPVAEAAGLNRQARELAFATTGPRKVVKKKDEHNPAASMHAHWSYEGEGGPAEWGKMRPEYGTCATGKRQSPIDIREGVRVDLEQIKFDYKPTLFRIIDNGHTVQVNVGEGSTINVMGKRFEMVQFHFHKPSEERVNGRPYDMVAHLVHKDYDGNLAVVAVLLERGMEHPLIQALWNNMPLEQNQEVSPSVSIDPARLLPENKTYWTYMGSLTTPPCSENVLWMVMKQPVQVSPEQVGVFARLYKNNARPIQPSNGRLIKESR